MSHLLAEHSWLYMAESSLAQKGNLLEGLVIMEKEEGLWVSRVQSGDCSSLELSLFLFSASL